MRLGGFCGELTTLNVPGITTGAHSAYANASRQELGWAKPSLGKNDGEILRLTVSYTLFSM